MRPDNGSSRGSSAAAPQTNPIVLRATGPDSVGALVITHPGALAVETYGVLAGLLSSDIGVYVYTLDRVPEYHTASMAGTDSDIALVDIAHRFADSLSEHVGELPFVILGWSFGGVVAYAVAEAAAKERDPAHVLLLDSIAVGSGDPGKKFGSVLPDREALDWFALYLGAKRGRRLGFGPADFGGVSVEDGLELILKRAVEKGALFGDTSVTGLRKVYETYVAGILRNKRLHDGYVPSSPRCPVSLVRPTRGLFDDVSRLGWEDLVGERLSTHWCTGDHYSMLSDAEPAALLVEIVESSLGRTGTTAQSE